MLPSFAAVGGLVEVCSGGEASGTIMKRRMTRATRRPRTARHRATPRSVPGSSLTVRCSTRYGVAGRQRKCGAPPSRCAGVPKRAYGRWNVRFLEADVGALVRNVLVAETGYQEFRITAF